MSSDSSPPARAVERKILDSADAGALVAAPPSDSSVVPISKKQQLLQQPSLHQHLDHPIAELNRLIESFQSSDKVRVELRPVASHTCFGDPSKALFSGAAQGNIALVRAGLISGMSPDALFRGQSPLMYAAENGHTAIVLLLIANGAAVNLVDKYNRAALHYACRNKHVGCAAALMDGGAKNDIECDLGGETPADLARHTGHRDLIRYVLFYANNVAEIRQVALASAMSQLRDVEGLALVPCQPVVEKSHAVEEAFEEATSIARQQRSAAAAALQQKWREEDAAASQKQQQQQQ